VSKRFVGVSLVLDRSQGIDATLRREGGVDARETEETKEEAAKLQGGGSGRAVGSLGTRGVVEGDRPVQQGLSAIVLGT